MSWQVYLQILFTSPICKTGKLLAAVSGQILLDNLQRVYL
jgi:hypothetical protein